MKNALKPLQPLHIPALCSHDMLYQREMLAARFENQRAAVCDTVQPVRS